jgi:sugar phosphate isomerase/epimerase
MNRRELLALATTAAALSPHLSAQDTMPGPAKLKIDIYSRHLLWLRSAEEVAAAAHEMGYDGIDLTIRPGLGGHVAPERVATDLPPFVAAIRKTGLKVSSITAPIVDAQSPHAEEILQAASEAGINHYWWGTFRYEVGKPVMQQLDALKPRVAALARLNEKYKMSAMYHTFAGTSVGASIWDLLYVLRDFDPHRVGFHYDTGHMASEGAAGSWATNLRAIGPWLSGIAAKDYAWEKGTNGQWNRRAVPLGQGFVRLPQIASILKELNFSGPVEIQAEYPNGGADQGRNEITLPREQVLLTMRNDQEVLRKALKEADLA